MTREQALNYLKSSGFSKEQIQAIVEALSGVDAISRAEMLKYQQYLHGKMSNEENHKLWEFIQDLPSVTPRLSSELEKNSKKLEKNFGELDCISREKAIAWAEYYIAVYDAETANKSIMIMLKGLLPITPIRPKGHWIDHSDDGYVECPKCGSATSCDDNIDDLHFCFSCGADMREVEE